MFNFEQNITKEINDIDITAVLRPVFPISQNTLLLKILKSIYDLFREDQLLREDVYAENKNKKNEYASLNINKLRSNLRSNMKISNDPWF